MTPKNAHEIISRQDVQTLVENLKKDYPVLVDDLIPGTISLGLLQRILQHLLKERIPIRDLVTILESISDYAATNKDANILGEFARASLYRTITKLYIDDEGKLRVFTLSPEIERMILENMQSTVHGVIVNLAPDVIDRLLKGVGELTERMMQNDQHPVALTSTSIRLAFRTLTEINYPKLAVLSYNEISPEVEIYSIGILKDR